MKNRHSKKCLSPSEVSGLDLPINASQNITSLHTKYSHFRWLWKEFLQINDNELLALFFFFFFFSP